MKRLLVFIFMAMFIVSCCLPQDIPDQYLKANASCEAYLPNYLEYASVINPCGDAAFLQEPVPGTILGVSQPHVKVTLTAINSFGNTDEKEFNVYITAFPEIIWDSIPSDTIPIAYANDIDLLFESTDTYRAYLGEPLQDSLRIWRIRQ